MVRSYNRGSTFVSRHFSHKGGGKGDGSGAGSGDGDCPGESEIHHKMKAIAYARMETTQGRLLNSSPTSRDAFLTCYWNSPSRVIYTARELQLKPSTGIREKTRKQS